MIICGGRILINFSRSFGEGDFLWNILGFSQGVVLGLFRRGVNHSLKISGNQYNKSEISYAEARNSFEKREILYAKCCSDLPLVFRDCQ